MSIRHQDGARADVAMMRLDDLDPVEKIYLERYPDGLKDLLILHLKAFKNLKNNLIARAFGCHKATPGRASKRASKRLAEIGKEFFSLVARQPAEPD